MPDQKCLPYGLIQFQYPVTDTKSLPTPEQQTAITKLSLISEQEQARKHNVVPVFHQGTETITFLSVAFASTFLKLASFISFFFPIPSHQRKQEAAGSNHLPFPERVSCKQRRRAGQVPHRAEATRLKTSAPGKPLSDAAPTFYYQQVDFMMLPNKYR